MTTVGRWSGRDTRLLRHALRLTVRDFAEDLGVSPRTVSKWEAGGATLQPRPELQRALDTMLARASDEERQRFLDASGRRVEHPGAACGMELPPATHSPVTVEAPGWLSTGKELILMAARESADYGRRHGHSNVHDVTLDQFAEDVRTLAVDFLSAEPIPTVLRARTLRNQAFDLLEGRQWPQQTRELYSLAGHLCGLLAIASSDFFGRYDAAAAQCRTAWLCAELADHNELRAWVRTLQSGVALWVGRYADAAALAQQAGEHSRTATGATRALVLQARALGRLGDADGVALAGYELDAPDAYVHGAVTRADLAQACLGGGDLDGAAEALHPVFGLPRERRLAGVARRTGPITAMLAHRRYRGAVVAHDMIGQIDQLRSDVAAFAAAED